MSTSNGRRFSNISGRGSSNSRKNSSNREDLRSRNRDNHPEKDLNHKNRKRNLKCSSQDKSRGKEDLNHKDRSNALRSRSVDKSLKNDLTNNKDNSLRKNLKVAEERGKIDGTMTGNDSNTLSDGGCADAVVCSGGEGDFMTFPKSSVAPLVACLFWVIGCVTVLPDVSTLEQNHISSGIPAILSSRDQVSQRETKSVVSRLRLKAGLSEILQEHISLMQSLSGHPLTSGNRVELLVDGPATNKAMFGAISKAQDHINLETFIFDDDEVGRQFADLLLQKQAEGIQVNLIYDSVGSMSTPSAFFERLKEGGMNVLEFNPVNPLKARKGTRVTHRDHRKTMIVDGKIAFTGGVNISNVYSRGSSSLTDQDRWRWEGWRDTHIQIEGPAVAQLQKLFIETWADQNGPALASRNYFPPLETKGKELVVIIGSTPGELNRLTYVMYVSAIKKSENYVHMTMAYFVPDRQSKNVIRDAARRGVDVKLVLPSSSDTRLTFYAGRSHYEDLLESGVKLYERQSSMLHAKTAVIDGVWSTVGSTNFNLWSFMRNNEINAIILGIDFANEMEELFNKDLAESKEVAKEQWSQRPLWERFKEFFARLVSHWL